MGFEHRLMGGGTGGSSLARSRAHIFHPLPQRQGSLGTAGTCARSADPRRLLQSLGTTSTSYSPPGWREPWSTRLRGRACAEKPEACKVKHTFVVWHQLFPATMGEQAPCAFQSPFPLHVASQWQY